MTTEDQPPVNAWAQVAWVLVVGAMTFATAWALSSEFRIAAVANSFARCVEHANPVDICRELVD